MRTKYAIVFALLIAALLSTARAAEELYLEQAQRDLTRVLSEVFNRALSQAQLGEVVRPEFASPKIDLSVAGLGDGWLPTCEMDIVVEASDARRNMQALVLVPGDRVDSRGASFTAFAFFAGEAVLTTDILRDPPAWLVDETGGYADLSEEWQRLLERSDVGISSTECDGFSFSIIEGGPK